MKKILLVLVCFLTVSAFAQSQAEFPIDKVNKGIEVKFVKPTDEIINLNATINPYTSSAKVFPTESQIGTTFYDLQSNSIYGERGYMADNGDMTAVWTMGKEPTAYPDRGSAYQFFDGTSWLPAPTERIEDARTGWPSITEVGAEGEMIVSHDFGDVKRLLFNKRDVRGTGDWNQFELLPPAGAEGLVWPRIATSGSDNNIVHVLANTYSDYEGQPAAALYSRSLDGGATWDINNVLLDGTGADDYEAIYADDYKLITKGNTVVILFSSNWIDLFYLRSDDNGDTWTKKMIWNNPYSDILYDDVVMVDTLWCPDNSLTAALDNNGKLHVAFGLTRTLKVEVGDSYTWFPWIDGIVYWNEDMEEFTDEIQDRALSYDNLVEDVTLVGYSPDVGDDGEFIWGSADFPLDYREMGVSTMPALSVDADGKIFLLWSSTTESLLFEGETQLNYKHIWGRAMAYGEWLPEITHVTGDFLHTWDECIMPWIIGTRDGNVHMFYHVDNTPGLALDEDHPHIENRVIYGSIPYADFGIGVDGYTAENNIVVSQNYPNPANNNTFVDINLTKNTEAMISVINMMGQTITSNLHNLNSGNNVVELNVNELTPGIYFYTVTVGAQNVTNKMIIN